MVEVIVGTYEEVILGYQLKSSDNGWEYDNSFSDHTHTGCVKTVGISSNGILAAGSSDERISLFSLRKRKELGMLMHHDGSVSCIRFFGKSHMFSASEDGTIGVWKVSNWECLRTLRGHKDAVYSISVHPSGKLAISVGKDKTMRTWNLITGKQAYITNIKQVAEEVLWCPSGEQYSLLFPTHIDVYSVETSEIIQKIKCDFRVHTITYLKEGLLVAGGDSGKVQIIETSIGETLLDIVTNTSRVKAICSCISPEDEDKYWLITGSSDGMIKLWEILQEEDSWSSNSIAEVDCKFRIVSMALFGGKTKEVFKETEATETSKQSQVTEPGKKNGSKEGKKRKKASSEPKKKKKGKTEN